QEVTTVVHIIGASPPAERANLAMVASGSRVTFKWFGAGDATSRALETAHYNQADVRAGRAIIASMIGNA
ncbi:hypothetical protein, partial [Gluconobacter kondonii]|uniref:hypothetical protein n=1 Tax=Gluconobacter kondonii TaxID=941463 RepID=UPI003570B8B1